MRKLLKIIIRVCIVLLVIILIIVCCLVYAFYPSTYKAKSISGIVFDAHSKQPVEGAVVVAIWSEYGGAFQAHKIDELEVQEVVTDSQGRYFLPGWPLKRSRNWSAFVPADEPRIFAYKYKYSPKYIYNGIADQNRRPPPYKHERIISWHGSTDIHMKPLIVTEKNRMLDVSEIEQITPSINGCRWKKLTHLLLELDKQREEFEKYWYFSQSGGHRSKCPGAIELLENARELRQGSTNEKN